MSCGHFLAAREHHRRRRVLSLAGHPHADPDWLLSGFARPRSSRVRERGRAIAPCASDTARDTQAIPADIEAVFVVTPCEPVPGGPLRMPRPVRSVAEVPSTTRRPPPDDRMIEPRAARCVRRRADARTNWRAPQRDCGVVGAPDTNRAPSVRAAPANSPAT